MGRGRRGARASNRKVREKGRKGWEVCKKGVFSGISEVPGREERAINGR